MTDIKDKYSIGNTIEYNQEDAQVIANCAFRWIRSEMHINNSSMKQASLDDDHNHIYEIIKNLEKGLKAFKEIKKHNTYSLQPFLRSCPDIDTQIKDIEFQIQLHRATLNFIKWQKKYLFNSDNIFLLAMIQVFTVAEKIGLEFTEKPGAGRGNTSKILDFVSMITGLNDRRLLQRYQKLYKKFKSTPEYRAKVLSLPEFESLMLCM